MTQSTMPLNALASIIRSKNAGPFRLTLDILFRDQSTFDKVIAAGSISPENVARAYGIPVSDVLSFYPVPAARAFKITLTRAVSQCAIGETDVYGCQQHVPLMMLPILVA